MIKDFLLPLGLDTNHGYGKAPVLNSEVSKKREGMEKRLRDIQRWTPAALSRASKASERYSQLCQETLAQTQERRRLLKKELQQSQGQEATPGQWYTERQRLKEEASNEIRQWWLRVTQVQKKANKEHAKWERYCRQQGELLRALEDLAAQERTMYELNNHKDQIMTMCKLTLANLAMWTRDQCFPALYAHATWARLVPFFQIPGIVISSQQMISVQLRPFNDRQYNRDLLLLCQRINEKQLHLPDGRLLLLSIQEIARPILYQQGRLNA